MLVLGTQVKQDGPCQSLRDRLDAALLHLKTQPDMQIIVAGGQGDDEPTTEAAAMSEYLVARGVAETQIWQEDKSRNTWQNLQNTKKLLAGKGLDPENTHLLMVSNNFHIFRAKMLAVRSGLTVSTLAAPTTHEPSRIKGYLREVPALVKAWVIDR